MQAAAALRVLGRVSMIASGLGLIALSAMLIALVLGFVLFLMMQAHGEPFSLASYRDTFTAVMADLFRLRPWQVLLGLSTPALIGVVMVLAGVRRGPALDGVPAAR